MKNVLGMILAQEAGVINGKQKRFLSLVDRAIDELAAVMFKCLQESIDLNPLTKLPGNGIINREINRWMQGKTKFAVCYLDIDHFKSFNDKYGYLKGDIIIKETASIIQSALERYGNGNGNDFIGHIGGDDFIIITTPDTVEEICQEIINSFDRFVPTVYEKKDRKNGYIEGKDRQDNIRRFPLMSVSIGVATNKTRKFKSPVQVAEIATDMKSFAKSFPGSQFKIDKRTT